MPIKRGRPKGFAFKTQEKVFLCLKSHVEGLNLKTILQRTRLNKKTAIKALKEFVERGFAEKRKAGRYCIYKITKRGDQYYYRLRTHELARRTKVFNFDRLFGKRARKLKLHTKKRFPEVEERLLQRFDEAVKNFDLTLRKIISEIAEEDKKKRIIELD